MFLKAGQYLYILTVRLECVTYIVTMIALLCLKCCWNSTSKTITSLEYCRELLNIFRLLGELNMLSNARAILYLLFADNTTVGFMEITDAIKTSCFDINHGVFSG